VILIWLYGILIDWEFEIIGDKVEVIEVKPSE
jgi:hypothetical protein